MKYEPIFGDQSLFDGMLPDAQFVCGEYGYAISNGKLIYCERHNQRCGWNNSCKNLNDFKPIAMRRIIKTQVWTVEDQKAGRLPEVGSLIVNVETGDQFSFVGVNAGSNRWACKDACDGLLYFFKSHEMSPIETPREKYDRERDECIDKLLAKIPPSPITVVPAMKIVYEELRPFTGGDHD